MDQTTPPLACHPMPAVRAAAMPTPAAELVLQCATGREGDCLQFLAVDDDDGLNVSVVDTCDGEPVSALFSMSPESEVRLRGWLNERQMARLVAGLEQGA
jgi:hypothetical protein